MENNKNNNDSSLPLMNVSGGTKTYWQSIEHLNKEPEFIKNAHNEFTQEIPVDEFLGNNSLNDTSHSRRDFLKFLGFSVSAATLAACETPVTRAIPYVVKPEEITPGVPSYYASTFNDGTDYCSILVKTREGRPIHIEGNKLSGITKGGVNARVNSSVLSLYDSNRLKGPMANGTDADWGNIDDEIKAKLSEIAAKGGTIALLTNSSIGPSTMEAIKEFSAKFNPGAKEGMTVPSEKPSKKEKPNINKTETQNSSSENLHANFKHVIYDAVSYSGLIKANESSFGLPVIPDYRFDKAKTIVSIGADFLVNWLSSIEYASQYGMNRKPGGPWMSKHFQFETILSPTGSNADVRGAILPSDFGSVAIAIYNHIASKSGLAELPGGKLSDENNLKSKVEEAANDLLNNKANSIVVCGSNDVSVQTVVNSINNLLGNYCNPGLGDSGTINLFCPLNLRKGNDIEVAELVKEMNEGKVDALLIYGANPCYTMSSSLNFNEALGKVKLKISFSENLNETAAMCDYVCPDHNYLESWNDANPKMGYYSLTQPVIRPLFNTRQAQSSLLKWAGMDSDFHKYIQSVWEKYGYPYLKTKYSSFNEFWNTSLREGVSEMAVPPKDKLADFKGDLKSAAEKINLVVSSKKSDSFELILYQKTSMGEGNQANNPWLQELPDPVTKAVWDNYITMNPSDMSQMGFSTILGQKELADVAKVVVDGKEIILPVISVPGQKKRTIGIAVGYGRSAAGKAGNGVGKNAFPLINYSNESFSYFSTGVSVEKSGETFVVATTQTQHTMMGRRIVLETDINSYKTIDPKDEHQGWNREVAVVNSYGNKVKAKDSNLWKDFNHEIGHRWTMAIDLNTCIGCGACVTACHSENNVPVVGKDEVRRNRDMHWLRIDRYFSSDSNKENNSYTEMEVPSEYPAVIFQPVMCQHCNHAPCETVCPVAATTHSEEGLNQMAYNRCVGTRYCANNCPYKVRRFNWFNYPGNPDFKNVNPAQDDLGRMVLNPDVVVRSRGVMEKCSLCVQRIQYGKLDAKKAGKPIEDGAIQTACASACPTHAITFGDYNNESSMAHKEANDSRAYHLLEEVGVQPNVWYLTKVRNVNEKFAPHPEHKMEEKKTEEHHS